MTQFRRAWRIQVGTLRVGAPIRAAFTLARSLRRTPNRAEVRLWNLTRDQQREIESAARGTVIVEAGYDDDRGLEQVFRGELFRAHGAERGIRTDVETVDAITRVEARDGGTAYLEARIGRSFERGVQVATVLRACADAMGVGHGNVDDVADLAQLDTGGAQFGEGTTLRGHAARELTRIAAGLGLRWSVQHGVLQLHRVGEGLRSQAIRLTPDTGLVGRAELGTRGRVRVTALLTKGLAPGRPVLLEDDRVRGRYLVRSVEVRGDSHGLDWYSICELAEEGTAA